MGAIPAARLYHTQYRELPPTHTHTHTLSVCPSVRLSVRASIARIRIVYVLEIRLNRVCNHSPGPVNLATESSASSAEAAFSAEETIESEREFQCLIASLVNVGIGKGDRKYQRVMLPVMPDKVIRRYTGFTGSGSG